MDDKCCSGDKKDTKISARLLVLSTKERWTTTAYSTPLKSPQCALDIEGKHQSIPISKQFCLSSSPIARFRLPCNSKGLQGPRGTNGKMGGGERGEEEMRGIYREHRLKKRLLLTEENRPPRDGARNRDHDDEKN